MLLIILLSLQLSRVLAQAAANNFPREVVFSLIGLTSVGYLPIVVPIGFFLAIMLALGRLYHESEMAAIQACGVGPAGLYRPIGILGALVAAALAWLTLTAIPQAMLRVHEIRDAAVRDAQFGSLEAGRFRSFGGGDVVFYAERVDDNGILHNVQVFVDRSAEGDEQGNKLEVWVASRAEQRGAGQAEQTFVLYDGRRYEGIPGRGDFRIISFSQGGIPLRMGELRSRSAGAEIKSTSELLMSAEREDAAELQARIAAPVMTLILMVIAVPLARLRPRQGRFGRLGLGILVYFVYSLVLDAAGTWIANGSMPAFLGLWWVHAIALGLGLVLLMRESPPVRARAVAAAGA